jgi:hypothetical protein
MLPKAVSCVKTADKVKCYPCLTEREKTLLPPERNQPCPCGSGLKFKKCHGLSGARLPPLQPYQVNRAIAYLGRLGRAREQFCQRYTRFKQAGLAEASRGLREEIESKGERVTCGRGCAHCCYVYVFATLQEAECIVHYLYEHQDALTHFRASFQEWKKGLRPIAASLPRLDALQGKTLRGEATAAEKEEFDTELTRYAARHVDCPFLRDDACTVYEVRPFVCAGVVSASPSAWCARDNPHAGEAKLYKTEFNLEIDLPYFLKSTNKVLYGCMPEMVHELLEGGYLFLSRIEGMDGVRAQVARDPEISATLKLLGMSLRPPG